MATTITVASILANTAQLIGVPPFAPTTNVTDAQALAWLQQSLESLQALNAQFLGEDKHHISSVTLRTQPGVNFVSLPSDAIEVFDVLWSRTPEAAYRLLPAESPYVLPLTVEPQTWECAPRFRLEGVSLVLFPTPSLVYPLSVWYGQAYTAPLATSVVQGRLDWAQWLELDLGCKCLQRKRRAADLAEMTARRDALAAQLFAPGRRRMRAGPQRIQDVYALAAGRPWWWG